MKHIKSLDNKTIWIILSPLKIHIHIKEQEKNTRRMYAKMLLVFSLNGFQIIFPFVFFCMFLDVSNNTRCFWNQKGNEH